MVLAMPGMSSLGKSSMEHAAGAAVADVEDQVDIHRRVGPVVRQGVEEADRGHTVLDRSLDQIEQRDPAGDMLELVGDVPLGVEGVAAIRLLELEEIVPEPVDDPFLVVARRAGQRIGLLVVEEAVDDVEIGDEIELLALFDVVGRRFRVGIVGAVRGVFLQFLTGRPRGRRIVLDLGIEGENDGCGWDRVRIPGPDCG